jgi:hypothetical protein
MVALMKKKPSSKYNEAKMPVLYSVYFELSITYQVVMLILLVVLL